MSKKQRAVFDYVAQYLSDHGYSPTIREVQLALGYAAPSTVHKHIDNLREMGMLTGSGRRLRLGYRAMERTSQSPGGKLLTD